MEDTSSTPIKSKNMLNLKKTDRGKANIRNSSILFDIFEGLKVNEVRDVIKNLNEVRRRIKIGEMFKCGRKSVAYTLTPLLKSCWDEKKLQGVGRTA